MARPRKLSLDYFPHDTDSVGDEKIEAIRALYGNDGYAFYFILLERIYRSDNAVLDISRFALRTALISKIGINMERFDEMLKASFEIGLFDRDTYEQTQSITSSGIQKRYLEVYSSRDKWRKKKDESEVTDDNEEVFQGENEQIEGFSPEKTPQSKGNKKKEKEKKQEYAEFVHMTVAEHEKLVEKHGHDRTLEMISILDNYKGSKGKKYANDYRAILSWVVKKVAENERSKPINKAQSKSNTALRMIQEAEERDRIRNREIVRSN